jgi:hypothetical protein
MRFPEYILRCIPDCALDNAHVDFQKFIKKLSPFYAKEIISNLITQI